MTRERKRERKNAKAHDTVQSLLSPGITGGTSYLIARGD